MEFVSESSLSVQESCEVGRGQSEVPKLGPDWEGYRSWVLFVQKQDLPLALQDESPFPRSHQRQNGIETA